MCYALPEQTNYVRRRFFGRVRCVEETEVRLRVRRVEERKHSRAEAAARGEAAELTTLDGLRRAQIGARSCALLLGIGGCEAAEGYRLQA